MMVAIDDRKMANLKKKHFGMKKIEHPSIKWVIKIKWIHKKNERKSKTITSNCALVSEKNDMIKNTAHKWVLSKSENNE